MTPPVAVKTGTPIVLVAYDAEHVTLELDFASPPGSTVDLVFEGAPLSVKVRACRRAGDSTPPRFVVEGRWVNLSRAQRHALLGGSSPTNR